MPLKDKSHIITVKDSASAIPAETWNACANPEASTYNPFVSYEFITALEKSGSVCPQTGWVPRHLFLSDETDPDRITGILPAYLKSHSYGEYVFDHAWADAYHRTGRSYYPKLQCSIPFTPATGPRLLVAPCSENMHHHKLLTAGAVELVQKLNLSSFHCTFLSENEANAMKDMGLLLRTGQQFHWFNDNYDSFDAFLQTLSSRKRKTIRKERREAVAHEITIKWLTGSNLQETHWDHFYEFYLDTSSRKWGQAYLNRTFFSLINEALQNRILLILCYRQDKVIAGALNFIGGDTLYGRNWGAIEDHKFLHFEACYYQAIDFAIEHGLSRVEAGAQGAHKIARGYVPTTTYSTHYIADADMRRAIAYYLQDERDYVELEKASLSEHLPFAKSCQPPKDERG